MSYKIYAQLTPVKKRFVPGVHVCANLRHAQRVGHTIIQHPNGRRYEEVIMGEPLITETRFGPVSVRNHTAVEFSVIRNQLQRVPSVLLDHFATTYNGIVCVDWSGPQWPATRPNPTSSDTLLSGGANIRRERTRNGITETGLRIELTHSAMYEFREPPFGRRGVFTLWHELGHVAYSTGMTPRSVERSDYGVSQHVGVSEQPAYAFMWYFLDPSKLTLRDRTAMESTLSRSSSSSSGSARTTRVWQTWLRRRSEATGVTLFNGRDGQRGVIGTYTSRDAASRECSADRPWIKQGRFECWIRKPTNAVYVGMHGGGIVANYESERQARDEGDVGQGAWMYSG